MDRRILGVVLVVIGGLLLYFGYQKTGAVTERAKQTITGDYTDRTMSICRRCGGRNRGDCAHRTRRAALIEPRLAHAEPWRWRLELQCRDGTDHRGSRPGRRAHCGQRRNLRARSARDRSRPLSPHAARPRTTRELLSLAGLVAKPERRDLVRMAKAFRRAEREAAKAHDRALVERAALRVQRKSPVYAPLKLELPRPEDLDERSSLRQERACYVCKQPFAKVHRYYDRCASRAATSITPSASSRRISTGTTRWSPAHGSRSAIRRRSSCCEPART